MTSYAWMNAQSVAEQWLERYGSLKIRMTTVVVEFLIKWISLVDFAS